MKKFPKKKNAYIEKLKNYRLEIVKITFSLKQIDVIIENYIIPRMKEQNIFIFKGHIGAGKTTIIKRILKKCGVSDIVSSPSFNYVNSYKSNDENFFHHFDLYRLDSLDSFLSLGFDEYFYKNKSFCFIEWPEIITSLFEHSDLKLQVCFVEISFVGDDFEKRSLKFF